MDFIYTLIHLLKIYKSTDDELRGKGKQKVHSVSLKNRPVEQKGATSLDLQLRRALASPPVMSSSSHAASPAPPASDTAEMPSGVKPATAPYGSWRSPITADVVASAEKRLGGIAVAGDGRLLWIESRPEEKG